MKKLVVVLLAASLVPEPRSRPVTRRLRWSFTTTRADATSSSARSAPATTSATSAYSSTRPRTATVRAISAVEVMALDRGRSTAPGRLEQTSQQLAQVMADRLIALAHATPDER